ncbi:hypothetical protein D9M70_462160 [compost metagenome]
MSYDDLRNYIGQLRRQPGTQDVRIDWNTIDENLVRAVNHDQLAGLQLADVVASSIYQAANPNLYGDYEEKYLLNLRRTFYRHKKKSLNGYGLKFWCVCDQEIRRILEIAERPEI